MVLRLGRFFLGILAVALATNLPAYADGFTINPTFDSSITGNANAGAIENSINNAIGTYESLFSDPISVSILFRYSSTAPDGSALGANTLAQSNYVIYSEGFSTYINSLTADAKTANDATAVAHLPTSPLATRIDPSSADGRAVGQNTPGVMTANGGIGGGTLDGIVTLNSTKPLQFDRTGGISAGNYDATRSIEHEIDEVLGLGSILPSTTDFTGSTAIRPQDLFRYSASGVRSLTSSGSANSYFSIDGGVTNIVGFNQNAGGDYGDWLSSPGCPALVQDAFSCSGQTADITATSPEAINLDVIGYDLTSANSAPEPASIFLLVMGLIATGLKRRF